MDPQATEWDVETALLDIDHRAKNPDVDDVLVTLLETTYPTLAIQNS